MPDITIAGATFRNVPQIDVPKDGGGSASFVYEEGTKQISTNGTHDVSGYLNAQVSVPSQSPVINPLSVTENGTYTAPSGVDGYSPVTVNVGGGGGITADDIAERTISGVVSGTAGSIQQYAFESCRSITGAVFNQATFIGSGAFSNCRSLSFAEASSAQAIYANAFADCVSLQTVSAERAETIGSSAFSNCRSLASIDLPRVTYIYQYAFLSCYALSVANLNKATTIGRSVFRSCSALMELHLESVSRVTTLSSVDAFYGTPIYTSVGGQYGSVFVPASFYESFLTASNWSAISSRIVSV